MGRLIKLEVENFKSYAGKQVVGPFDDFTCIIGPNGAGKSNMMDAISFVLGVQSRHLRSSQLKDLVFRQTMESAPAKKAVVRLFYQLSDEEKETEKEIVFCRSVTSSGVTQCQVDGRDVAYEAYERALESIGVLVKARNFLVFQGDIESVAQKSPAELTKLIEQISGSENYRKEYEDLLQKKAEAEENMILMMQKKKLFASQRKEVKDQKDEAQEYAIKQDELKELKSTMTLWKIFKIKQSIKEKEESSTVIGEELDAVGVEEGKVEKRLLDNKKELAKANTESSNIEKKVQQVEKSMDTVKSSMFELRAKLTNLRKREADIHKTTSQVKKDTSNQTAAVEKLENQLAALQREEVLLKELLNNSKDAFGALDSEGLSEYLKLKEEVIALTAADKTKCDVVSQDIKSAELRLSQLTKEKTSIEAEHTNDKVSLEDFKTRLLRLENDIKFTENEMSQITQDKQNARQLLDSRDATLATSRQELEEVTNKLSEASDDDRRNRQETKDMEAVEAMKRIFSGVHGRLVDLCKPTQKKFGNAIVTAAGKQMDAIVVDTKQVASECIGYLKDQRIGTFLFLPLDSLKIAPIPERLRNFGPKYHLCVDLLEFDEKFRPAVVYAVGATIVCDTLEDAQFLCFDRKENVKVVTLRGHIISKSGAMTGGSTNAREFQDRWKNNELFAMKQRKSELEDIILKGNSAERQQLMHLENSFQAMQSKIQFSKAEIEITNEKIFQLSQKLALQSTEITKLDTQMEALTTKLNGLATSLQSFNTTVEDVEKQIFHDFSARTGIANVRELEEKHIQEHQKIFHRLKEIHERMNDIGVHLDYEMKKKFDVITKKLQDQSNTLAEDIRKCEQEESDFAKKETVSASKVAELKKEAKECNNKKEQLMKANKELQSEMGVLSKKKDGLMSKLTLDEIAFEKLRSLLHETLHQAQIEEIHVPTIVVDGGHGNDSFSQTHSREESGGGVSSSQRSYWSQQLLQWNGSQANSNSASNNNNSRQRGHHHVIENAEHSSSTHPSMSSSAHFSQSQDPIVLRDERQMICVDLSSIEPVKKMSIKQIEENVSRCENKIVELQSVLEKLQPNMHAAGRLETMNQKLQETNEDLEELKRVTKEVTTAFESVRKQRLSHFQECFQYVSEALAVIYRDLTRSSKNPLGGNAFLSLDNTEEPYLSGIRFTAMPPMKRFRDMEQLSGGEKTVAAIALLFSIHSYRQAPFFVLDEIDAALDNVNVKKVCNYIRQRSKDFQCIVISLKDIFYENADCLVGVCKDVDTLSSSVLTLDLKKFQ